MPTHHDQPKESTEKTISIEPIVLKNVLVKTVEREVIDPVLVPKNIDVPNYVKKDQIKYITNEEVQTKLITNEENQTKYNTKYEDSTKYIKKEEDTTFYVKKEEDTTKYIKKEEDTTKYIKKEVPYEFPVVSMEQANKIASEVTTVLTNAKEMLQEISEAVGLLKATISEVKEVIPKEIIKPNIIHEDVIVKDVKIVKETLRVIGKVVAREK